MSRSKWKFKYIPTSLAKLTKRKIWDRDIIIQEKMVGLNPSVYNGQKFFRTRIDSEKVGYKLGEFIYTRKHVKKKDKKNKKSKKK